MSITPRTDALPRIRQAGETEYVPIDDCRQLERELAEAQNILKQCLSIMPVGYVPTHTVENLPEMIGDLAKALAEETTEREQLERELAEMTKQRDHYKAACDQYSEDEALNMLAEIRKQRDALAEAIRSFNTCFERVVWGYDGDCGTYRLVDRLLEALSAVKGGSDE
jgi:hypothetical protein